MARTMQTANRKKSRPVKRNLHEAVRKRDVALVRDMLSRPDIDVNEIDESKSDKFTALMLACKWKRAEIVNELLAHPNIDVNVSRAKDGVTALMIACSDDYEGIVRSLLAKEHINLNETDKIKDLGYTALMYAAAKGFTDVVRALLDHKDIDVNITSAKDGLTALMCAAQYGNIGAVKVLLTHKDTDTKVISKDKQTAFKLAISSDIKDAISVHETRQGTTAVSSRAQPHVLVSLPCTPAPHTASTARKIALTSSAASTHTADSSSSAEQDEGDEEVEVWTKESESEEEHDAQEEQEESEDEEESEWFVGGGQKQPPGRTVHLRTSAFLVDSPLDNSKPAAQLDIPVVATDAGPEVSKKRPFSSITEAFKSVTQQPAAPVRVAALAKSSMIAVPLDPVPVSVSVPAPSSVPPVVSSSAASTASAPAPSAVHSALPSTVSSTGSVPSPVPSSVTAAPASTVATQPMVLSEAAPTRRQPAVAALDAPALARTAPPSSHTTASLPLHVAVCTPHTTIIDHSSRTWLTDRMAKTGYSKTIADDCHEKLVEEQGFVQESLFAELTDADLDFAPFGISGKGTQLYLTRLHRELRAQYFPHAGAVNTMGTGFVTDKDTLQAVGPAAQRPQLT